MSFALSTNSKVDELNGMITQLQQEMNINKSVLKTEEQKSISTKIKDKIKEDAIFTQLKEAINDLDDDSSFKIHYIEKEKESLKNELKQS
jgi:hypothetical protein